MSMSSHPPIFAVRRTPRGWRCSCAWCSQRRWHGSEPDRHPIIYEPVEREPKPAARIVCLPRRELKS